MLNRITMTGRLTRDPELRTTQGNRSVTNFSIANQRNYKNSSGERDTDFFDVGGNCVIKYGNKMLSFKTIKGQSYQLKYEDRKSTRLNSSHT